MPSVEITGFQGLALLAQSRVLARLIPEPGTMVGSSACLLIMLTRLVIPGSAAVDRPTSVGTPNQPSFAQLTMRQSRGVAFIRFFLFSLVIFFSDFA